MTSVSEGDTEPPLDPLPPDWLPAQLSDTWTFLAAYPLALAAVIFIVGLTLAVFVRMFILFWGLKITARTVTDLDEALLRIVAGVAALLIGYSAMALAIASLGLPEVAANITLRLLASLLVLQLMRVAMRAAHVGLAILGTIRDRFAIVEERTIPLFDLSLTIIIVAAASYALLQIWNIDPTAWLASAGIIGIAVGFAARDTLANLFAGFFIIADSPYKLGDYVVLDSGERGMVTKVGIRSTRLLTRDDVEIIVPNSTMANTKVVNESGGRWEKFRIRIQVGVAYGTKAEEVIELLQNIAVEHDKVCEDPAPRVRMRGFGDSSINFDLLCWIDHPADRGFVSHELYMQIYNALNDADIVIPFPQRDVWMRTDGKPAASGDD